MKNKLAGASLTVIGLVLSANAAFANVDVESLPTAQSLLGKACKEEISEMEERVLKMENRAVTEETLAAIQAKRIASIQRDAPLAAKKVLETLDQMNRTADALRNTKLAAIAARYIEQKSALENAPFLIGLTTARALHGTYDDAVKQAMTEGLAAAGFDVAGIKNERLEVENKEDGTVMKISWGFARSEGKISLIYTVSSTRDTESPINYQNVLVTVDNLNLLNNMFFHAETQVGGILLGVDQGSYQRAGIEPGDDTATKEAKLAERFVNVATQELSEIGMRYQVQKAQQELQELQTFCAKPLAAP